VNIWKHPMKGKKGPRKRKLRAGELFCEQGSCELCSRRFHRGKGRHKSAGGGKSTKSKNRDKTDLAIGRKDGRRSNTPVGMNGGSSAGTGGKKHRGEAASQKLKKQWCTKWGKLDSDERANWGGGPRSANESLL